MMRAVVIPFGCRWLLCRQTPQGVTTAISDYPTQAAAERDAAHVQCAYDAMDNVAPAPVFDPWAPRQMVFGFYGADQGDT